MNGWVFRLTKHTHTKQTQQTNEIKVKSTKKFDYYYVDEDDDDDDE